MFKKGDVLILILSLAIVSYVAYIILGSPSQGTDVRITAPAGVFIYRLAENQIIEVEGLDGKSVIQIQDKKVSFLDSACPNHLCQKGSISHSGEYLACIPNSVMVVITGNPKGVDDVSY